MARTALAANPQAALELVNGYSLEMTGKDVPGLMEAKDSIPAGTKINVTFLGNEDLEMRVAAAKAVREMASSRSRTSRPAVWRLARSLRSSSPACRMSAPPRASSSSAVTRPLPRARTRTRTM